MKSPYPHFIIIIIIIVIISSLLPISPHSQPLSNDTTAMLSLKNSLNPPPQLGWSDVDPCKWRHVFCNATTHRVTRIQIAHQNLQGTLPLNLTHLTHLQHLELQYNNITGPLPSLTGLTSLQLLLLNNNRFTLIPHDFFTNLYSLQSINIDDNPFSAWVIPESLRNCTLLTDFSANYANITGRIPDFFSPIVFSAMKSLHLAFNSLEGELPMSLRGLGVESFWVNGQMGKGRLGGGIGVLRNMTSLREVWLHKNAFTGELPDFSGLRKLESLSVRDNLLTGVVPLSLLRLQSLRVVNLTNNLLQGGVPVFNVSISVDMSVGSNSFCLPKPGECDGRVNVLLSVAKAMGYPVKFAENWKGNDPCDDWFGITCNDGNVSIVNFEKMGLNGSISPDFSALKSLQRLVLAGNNLTGTIPVELTTLPELTLLDVSKNQLRGKVPAFKSNLILKMNGNVDIEKDINVFASPGKNSSGTSGLVSGSNVSVGNGVKKKSKSSIGVIVLLIMGGVLVICLIGLVVFCFYESKQKRVSKVQSPNAMVIHSRHSGSDADSVKVTVAGSSGVVGAVSEAHTVPTTESSDIQMVEAGNMVISIQVLKNVTNNFSTDNILGKGGFGTVYKGELHDGTKIAVKRMEGGVIVGKGLAEFKSEIAVLTKVRHRHLVALLGYCLDGNEKLLVYEYMPQGTLSRHLFNWPKEGLKPLEWTRRLAIALDVARGVEYLHGLAHQSFIHRDLKPSNILLGDDMRAKVSDFGLVRLAPEGKGSIETRIAGTFGYLAPEYAVTGRVTTKADVFSFGVILMELITGRKALDESRPEESVHLVTWFRRMHLKKDTFQKAIDPSLDLNEETLASISTAAELAGHCCAREPYQRPDMGHAVNVLSSLVEIWRPSQQGSDDIYCIDLDMSLPQALKNWQAFEGRSHMDSPSSSSFVANMDNTSTSIPNRPIGFAESFTSVDGR